MTFNIGLVLRVLSIASIFFGYTTFLMTVGRPMPLAGSGSRNIRDRLYKIGFLHLTFL